MIATSQARQNPFFPSKGEVDIPYTSNTKISSPPLKRATISVPSDARVIKKITVEYLNLDGSNSTTSIKLNNTVDWHLPIFVSQSMGKIESKQKTTTKLKVEKNYTQLYDLGFISFYKKEKEFKVVTTDKMIRSFLLTKPHRIVMDFKRKLRVKSKVKELSERYYKKISFGVHKDYYRIVLELDGHYRYNKDKIKKGYILSIY